MISVYFTLLSQDLFLNISVIRVSIPDGVCNFKSHYQTITRILRPLYKPACYYFMLHTNIQPKHFLFVNYLT